MSERQKHGFEYETLIIQRYGFKKEENYTSEWDAYFGDIPVSIKCSKYRTDVEYGDLFRNLTKEKDFLLFVGFHNGPNKEIVEEHILYIPAEGWKKFFSVEIAQQYRDLLAEITNDSKDDAKWRQAIDDLRARWKKEVGSTIVPRPKRDHKKQKRIQCATTYTNFIKVLVARFGVSSNDWNNKIFGTKTPSR